MPIDTALAGQQIDAGGIVFLYALSEEARHFGGMIQCNSVSGAKSPDANVSENRSAGGFKAFPIGVGPDNAVRHTSFICRKEHPLRALVIVGFAGGLDDRLLPGDLVLVDEVVDAQSSTRYSCDPDLLAVSERVRLSGFQIERGLCVSVHQVLIQAAEKRTLAAKTGAIVVDMESAGAAEAAARNGVPWIAVRVITDGLNDDLPLDFNALANSDGSVNRARVALSALLHPWKIPGLIRLGFRSDRAARNLGVFLQALAPLLSK